MDSHFFYYVKDMDISNSWYQYEKTLFGINELLLFYYLIHACSKKCKGNGLWWMFSNVDYWFIVAYIHFQRKLSHFHCYFDPLHVHTCKNINLLHWHSLNIYLMFPNNIRHVLLLIMKVLKTYIISKKWCWSIICAIQTYFFHA